MDFWTEFLDRMAENRYNLLSLWTLSPFPSLVQIPEYPEACLNDVKISARSFHADLRGRHDLIGTGVPVTADCKYFECAVDHAVLSGFFEIPEFFVHLTDLRILT